jgi:hypothetical protein
MAKKASVGEVRVYLVLAGVAFGIESVRAALDWLGYRFAIDLTLLLWSSFVLGLGFAGAFVVAGIWLRRERVRGAGWIRKLLGLHILLLALEALLTLVILDGPRPPEAVGSALVRMVISGYLLHQLSELAEAISEPELPQEREL